MKKKGITLITLGIVIVILSIIAGAVIINVSGLIGDAELSNFADEINTIEDKIKEYYLLTGIYPVLKDNAYSATQITSMNTLGYNELLTAEISKNGDQHSTFYSIDYDKIEVELLERGLKNTTDDIYVVAQETGNVYYIRGLETADIVYFSLVNMTDNTQIK